MVKVVCHLPTGLFLDIPDPKHKGQDIRAATLAFGLNEVDDGVWKAWLAVHHNGDLITGAMVQEIVAQPVDAPKVSAKSAVPPAAGSAAARAAAKAAKGK